MRVLFLTNFYPPVSRGGYEEWCKEVAEGLRDRGHEIVVLTSRNGRSSLPQPDPPWIHRDLHLEMAFASFRNSLHFFTNRHDHEQENLDILQQYIVDQQPDAILIWGMWNLPRSLPAMAETLLPHSTFYYMGDYWPTLPSQWQNYWQVPPQNWMTAAPKLLLKPIAKRELAQDKRPALNLERVLFPTHFLKDEFGRRGIEPAESRIVNGAIDTSEYDEGNGRYPHKQDDDLILLYMGRLSQEKGVHTAVKAVSYLVNQKNLTHVQLQVVGTGEPEYVAHLHQLVQEAQVQDYVKFLGMLPKQSIPGIYQQADIFLFTSIWPEPFGRVIVEAMASGVAVVGTPVGGAAEIMVDNENALLFATDNPEQLASQIEKLIKTPKLRQNISEAGRETAVTKFDLQRMVDGIEAYLETVLIKT